jgi:hypothetical protein
MDIIVTNMAPIFTKMRGDTISACLLCQQRGINRIWMCTTARVSYSRDMIDIDAKP